MPRIGMALRGVRCLPSALLDKIGDELCPTRSGRCRHLVVGLLKPPQRIFGVVGPSAKTLESLTVFRHRRVPTGDGQVAAAGVFDVEDLAEVDVELEQGG